MASALAADDPGTGAGADGAPGPSAAPRMGILALPAGGTSYNDWPVGTPTSAIGVQSFVVPGTTVTLPIKACVDHPAVRRQAVQRGGRDWQCWGYAYRANVNKPSVWSNHASGTAIDLNAVKHPNGAKASFTAAQTAAARRILAFCGKVVRWGQDYTGTVDGMRFEINVPPGDPSLARLATRIRAGGEVPPTGYPDSVPAQPNSKVRLNGWAFDTDQPDTQIQVAVYRNGEWVGWFPTGGSRSDVNAAYGIGGRHGFSFSVPSPPGNQRFDMYAINVSPPADNVYFGSGTVTVG